MTVDYTQPPAAPGAPAQPGQKPKSSCGTIAAIGCAVIIAIGAVIVGGLVFFVFGIIKSTDVYKQALARAKSNPEVIARLGEPIEAGWWVSGSVTVNKESGTARFSFPIAGPKAKATVTVEATRERDRWLYSILRAKPDNGGEIDLLAAP
jgi:cytochrome oxidase complex assembly protein 1